VLDYPRTPHIPEEPMPPYTQPRPTAQGFQWGQPQGGLGQSFGYPSRTPQPMQMPQFPPNPFGGVASSRSSYGQSGFGGYSQQQSMPAFAPGATQRGLGGAQGWGAQMSPQRPSQGQPGQMGTYAQIVDGGIMGAPDHDSSMTDWFAPRGSPVKSPVSGTIVSSGNGYFGQVGLAIRGDDGSQWEMRHVQGQAQPGMRVQAGQPVAVISDDSLPAGYQHVDIRRNGQGATPLLRQAGARAELKPTSGPSHGGNWMANAPLGGGGGGGGYGGGVGGFPGMPGMGGGMPGMGGPMGFPGAGMGMPPIPGMNPFGGMGGMGGMMGGMGGFPGMGMGMGGMNPFMGGGMPGMGGGMGMPMPGMNPFMFGGMR
jgi:hypothetical protein